MNFIEHYYKKTIKYDFINKFNYNNLKEIPKFKKIILNFGCQNFSLQKFAITLFSLELLAKKQGRITLHKNANVLLKIQKGAPSGCQVIVTKSLMYDFLTKLLVEIFPKIKNFSELKLTIIDHTFSYKFLSNTLVLTELQEYYPIFNNLPHLNCTIITTAKNYKELIFLIKSFNLPIHKNK